MQLPASMQEPADRCAIEITGLKDAVTQQDLERFLRPLVPGLTSISYAGTRSRKCTIEVASRVQAQAALNVLNQQRDPAIVFRGTLRASIVAPSGHSASFTQMEVEQRWAFIDATALDPAQQEAKNTTDLHELFERLGDGAMRTSLEKFVERKRLDEDRVLKEMYLAFGRPCEMVFAGARGERVQHVLRARENVQEAHLDQFRSLFNDMPNEARRTGIDGTLHRISRSFHAVAKRATAVTARVGRTIQGTVLPMLVDTTAVEPLDALAQACTRGLLIIGQPNVGKTTVLRELARLLSHGDKRVVCIVDKSLEIAGTGVVPHEAIGNARVLTVERPQDQDKVMIEAVENQSPDIVIVDELTNKEQCNAARTITGRGVAVVATVHGDGLSSLMNDHERSLLFGGFASVTLSAKEAEARPDKLRQVTKRTGGTVFGTAVELRGYYDFILHDDLEGAVDKYLDNLPMQASWRVREGRDVISTPLIGCRQQGSVVGFGYARLRRGEKLTMSEDGGGVDFQATDPVSGQRIWTEVGGPSSNIYERTHRQNEAFSFGAGSGAPHSPRNDAAMGHGTPPAMGRVPGGPTFRMAGGGAPSP